MKNELEVLEINKSKIENENMQLVSKIKDQGIKNFNIKNFNITQLNKEEKSEINKYKI